MGQTTEDADLNNDHHNNHEHRTIGTLANCLGFNSSVIQEISGSDLSSVALGIASQVGSRVGDAMELVHSKTRRRAGEEFSNDVMMIETTNASPSRWKKYIPCKTVDRLSGNNDDTSTDILTGFCKELHELPV
jgi:hypothetical protein